MHAYLRGRNITLINGDGWLRFLLPPYIHTANVNSIPPAIIQPTNVLQGGDETTKSRLNNVERLDNPAVICASPLRVIVGSTEVLTGAEDNVRQKSRVEGVARRRHYLK